MNDPKGGVAKVTCPIFEAMGQIPMFHRTHFLLDLFVVRRCVSHTNLECGISLIDPSIRPGILVPMPKVGFQTT